MLTKLLRALAGEKDESDETRLPTLTALLLLEVARCDEEFDDRERKVIVEAVVSRFGLPQADADEALAEAERRRERATDYWEITTEANRRLSVAEKIDVIETAWRVIDADGHVSLHEDALIRRLASLLRVTHGEMIAAKKRARS